MKRAASKRQNTIKPNIPYFLSDSQRNSLGRKNILFGSKRATALTVLLVFVSIFGGVAIIQKSRDSSAQSLFQVNYEDGTLGPWAGCQSHNHATGGTIYNCGTTANGYAISNSTAKASQGTHSLRFEVRDGDTAITAGERAEVQTTGTNTGGYSGQGTWYSWDTYFDASYPNIPTSPSNQGPGWNIFTQWHGNDSVSPPLSFWAGGNSIYLATGTGNSYTTQWSGPMNRGQWNHFKIYVKWADAGAIKFYYNNQLVLDKTNVDTLTTPPVYLKQGIYRGPGVSGTAITYFDDLRIGSSESDVAGGTTTPAPSPAPAPTPAPTPTPAPSPTPTPSPSPTPTPSPNPSPSPTPSPTPTPTSGQLQSNNWSAWQFYEAVTNGTVSKSFTRSQSGRLLVQFDGATSGYKGDQYGRYCIIRSATSPQPKSITYTVSYNAKYGNTVYFYADDPYNKLWQISNTDGNTLTKTMTINLKSQKRYCFGNVSIPNLASYKFAGNRFINVTSYKFNY